MPENDPVMVALCALTTQIDVHRGSIDKVIADHRAITDEQGRKLDLILTAFPNGDPAGHRAYHEAMMEAIVERKRIRQAVLEHVLKTSTWLLLAGLVLVSLQSVRQWLRGAAA